MAEVFTISDIARKYKVAPRVLSGWFYSRKLDDQRCPIASGRRLIPSDYVPVIETALREAGLITGQAAEGVSA